MIYFFYGIFIMLGITFVFPFFPRKQKIYSLIVELCTLSTGLFPLMTFFCTQSNHSGILIHHFLCLSPKQISLIYYASAFGVLHYLFLIGNNLKDVDFTNISSSYIDGLLRIGCSLSFSYMLIYY